MSPMRKNVNVGGSSRLLGPGTHPVQRTGEMAALRSFETSHRRDVEANGRRAFAG
ncbi:MAG: hypothetical protein ACHQ7N_00695 [Candidatus Methylomirabilales bacterium]